MNPGKQTPKFSVAITTAGYQKLINNTLGDPERAKRFVASITSAVAVNPLLQDCDAGTVLAAALLGESLNLSPSPQLGQYYLVPFECKVKDDNGKTIYLTDNDGKKLKDEKGHWVALTEKRAQFVLGYKGYVQLALRSGYYADIDVFDIKEGEYLGKDSQTGKPRFQFVEDDDERDALPTIGYMAHFEYLNGFRKSIYWSKKRMMNHADMYSPAFSASMYEKVQNGEVAKEDMWKYSSFWYKNFSDMARKTLLRQLIGKWGVMSVELQNAFSGDTTTVSIDGNNNLIPIPIAPDDEPPVTGAPNPVPNPDIARPEADTVIEKVDLSAL